MNIAQFYTKMKALGDKIERCTSDFLGRVNKEKQDHRLLHFLNKVNEQYDQVRSSIIMMLDLPNFNLSYRTLLQSQTHKELSKNTVIINNSLSFVLRQISQERI